MTERLLAEIAVECVKTDLGLRSKRKRRTQNLLNKDFETSLAVVNLDAQTKYQSDNLSRLYRLANKYVGKPYLLLEAEVRKRFNGKNGILEHHILAHFDELIEYKHVEIHPSGKVTTRDYSDILS